MKEHIDFFETFKSEFLGTKRFQNKLIRLWGTELLDGIEVMNQRFMIYPNINSSDNTVKTRVLRMCKMLGIKNQMEEADFSPIAGYYLWFNPDKGSASQLNLNDLLLAEKIDEFCPRYEWRYSTINYVDKADPTKFDGWTKEQILTYIDNDYRNIFSLDNGFVIGDTIEQTAMGKYVLFDIDGEFEVEVLSDQITAIPVTNVSNYLTTSTNRLRYTGLSIDIRYRRVTPSVDPTKSLVIAMKAEQEEYRLKVLLELQNSSSSIMYSEEGSGLFGQKEPTTDLVWYKDRLRLSAIKGIGIPSKTVVNTILDTLDTGQIKKKVKWYKKLLGIVLIVVVLYFTWGYGWQVVAIAMGVTAVVLSVIQAQWAKNNAAAAGYMGRWVRIANIISITASVYTSWKQALLRMATSKAVEKVTGSTELGEVAGLAVGAANGPKGGFSLSDLATKVGDYLTKEWASMSMKVANMALRYIQTERNADLADREAIVAAQNETLESTDSNTLFGLEHIKQAPEQLAGIATRYDYDFPYGAEYATIHIGNIQRSSYAKGAGLNVIT